MTSLARPAKKSAIRYAIGLDFGTNSARCLIVRVSDGAEIASAIHPYSSGEAGILLDRKNPHLARQHPADYLAVLEKAVPRAIQSARKKDRRFSPEAVIGVGVDTTGSTPLPVDAQGRPLALDPRFKKNLNAMAWLWKDHTATEEAGEITRRAAAEHPEYLAKCGGVYSSEWFWSKIWHCLNAAPDVFRAAYAWIELCDWIPAVLTGQTTPSQFKIGICAAGHKGMFHADWRGWPAREFLAGLAPELGALRDRLAPQAFTSDHSAGTLSPQWSAKWGLPADNPVVIPVAVGALDAHLGAVGSGIRPGTLVKIMGTSTCDMMVWPAEQSPPDIPGVCGIVPGSILPDCTGIEAGQSAVGDLFNWFVQYLQPGGAKTGSHEALTKKAAKLRPGESGLLALDWNNGNRCVLVDQRLTGLLLGQTLQTRPEEIYRALIEATAFGALIIINRLEEYGVKIAEVVNCGGIAEKNPFVMQLYADVTGRPMKLARSGQACALGAAICGVVVARKEAGGYDSFGEASARMTGVKNRVFAPEPKAHAVYRELFALYKELHDAFGTTSWNGNLAKVMKRLLELRSRNCYKA